MAEVDTSIYANLKPPNALETLGNLTNLQNSQNQNKLFQQEYNSKLGLSQIYKQAIDPNTGQIDPAKINQLLADPSTSQNVTYGLPQAIQNSQEAQQRNIGIDTSKLANAQQHLQALTSYLGPLANGNPTQSDVATALSHALTSGIANGQEITQLWSAIPRDQNGNMTPDAIKGFAQQNLMRVMSAQEQLNAMHPAPTLVQNGQSQIPMRLPQIGNPSVAGAAIPNLPAPTQQVYNPSTRQMEFVGNQPNGGMGAGGGVGIAPGTSAAPPLGAPEASSVVGQNSAQQGVALQQMADQVPARKALLGNLEGALDKFTSGPGQNWKQVASTFVNANSPFGNVFDPKSIASQEEFNKMSTQLAQSQFQSLGGTGTDAKLDSAMHTSPNDALSKLGNKGIIAMLKGNEDAINVKNQSWQSWLQNHGPESYGQFSTQFNKSYDPRVFQSQYLTPDDNKKLISGMTKGEQKQFLNSYRTALQQGWVKLPGAQ